MTITNQQVIRLKQMIHKYNQEIAAAKSGMSTKTARKYLSSNKTPSELKKECHLFRCLFVAHNLFIRIAKVLYLFSSTKLF